MSKDNIGSIFDKTKNIFSYEESTEFVEPRCIIGVEVELENMRQASGYAMHGFPRNRAIADQHFSFDSDTSGVMFGVGYWNVKSDGSLRNDGVEFVSKKIFGKDLSLALTELHNYLEDKREHYPKISDRCSVHIHLDVTDLDKNEYARLLIDYAIFENVLFNYCGVHRKENLYCLPFAKSDEFKRTLSHILTSVSKDLEFKKYVNSFPKYSALNLNATSKFGSLEFRLHGGTYDMLEVKEWINIIMCLKKNCIGNSSYNLHREISRFGISNYLEKVFGKYSGVLDYSRCETDVLEGIRLAQDILMYNNMVAISMEYFKNNNVLLSSKASIQDQLDNYVVPTPLNGYLTRIDKVQKKSPLRATLGNFFYDEPDHYDREEENEDEEYDEEDYDEGQYDENDDYRDED